MNRTRLLFETVVGSHAYGTAGPHSDRDIKGVFVEPLSSLLTLDPPPAQIDEDRGNVVYYALRRFLELALGANPNIIELLHMPGDCVLHVDPAFQPVLEARSLFITKQAYASHVRYAEAQIRKARGRNKWVNNPQPRQPPRPRDFCWFIPRDAKDAMPLRPAPLAASEIDLDQCHASALEHTAQMYRLYHYGNVARGVFRDGQIVCTSIPVEDEHARCIGLLLFNTDAHQRAVRDHRNYWEWHTHRNPRRWQSQESGELDYDAKNMMHLFRLMISAGHILAEGRPLVRFEGADLAYLKAVLAGEFSYDSLIAAAEERRARLEALHAASTLPKEPDRERAEALLKEVTAQWEAAHA